MQLERFNPIVQHLQLQQQHPYEEDEVGCRTPVKQKTICVYNSFLLEKDHNNVRDNHGERSVITPTNPSAELKILLQKLNLFSDGNDNDDEPAIVVRNSGTTMESSSSSLSSSQTAQATAITTTTATTASASITPRKVSIGPILPTMTTTTTATTTIPSKVEYLRNLLVQEKLRVQKKRQDIIHAREREMMMTAKVRKPTTVATLTTTTPITTPTMLAVVMKRCQVEREQLPDASTVLTSNNVGVLMEDETRENGQHQQDADLGSRVKQGGEEQDQQGKIQSTLSSRDKVMDNQNNTPSYRNYRYAKMMPKQGRSGSSRRRMYGSMRSNDDDDATTTVGASAVGDGNTNTVAAAAAVCTLPVVHEDVPLLEEEAPIIMSSSHTEPRRSSKRGRNRNRSLSKTTSRSRSRGSNKHGDHTTTSAAVASSTSIHDQNDKSSNQKQVVRPSLQSSLSTSSTTLPLSSLSILQRVKVVNMEWTVPGRHASCEYSLRAAAGGGAAAGAAGMYNGMAWKGKVPHGFGVLRFVESGHVYTGPFKYGEMHGSTPKALYRTAASYYVGTFRHNVKSGAGEEVYAHNGHRYVGKFQKGLPNGFGIEFNPDGSVVHLGMWCDGKPVVTTKKKMTKKKQDLDNINSTTTVASTTRTCTMSLSQHLSHHHKTRNENHVMTLEGNNNDDDDDDEKTTGSESTVSTRESEEGQSMDFHSPFVTACAV